MKYIPTPGPLPGEQWIPSNGTVGYSFLENECGNCARDKSMREGAPLDECDDNECCPIIAASFRGEAVEWRSMPDGEVKCIKFVPAGQPMPPEKDDRTIDMFAGDANEGKTMFSCMGCYPALCRCPDRDSGEAMSDEKGAGNEKGI